VIPLADTVHSRSAPLVNISLILINVVVFIYETSLGRQIEPFLNTWGVIPAELLANPLEEWPTLFTAMFLHGGWFHLISNMWALWIFGDNVEDRMGSLTYLLFYLGAGVIASLVQVFFSQGSMIPSVGASGAIAGVLGAYLVLFPTARVIGLIPIFFFLYTVELPALLYLGFWFISQLFSGVAGLAFADTAQEVGGIAYWAHAGGFVVGLLVGPRFRRRPRQRYWPDQYFPF